METKRMLGYGILLWLLIFVWWSIMVILPVLAGKETLQYIIHYVLLIPASVFCARLYYKSGDDTNGFLTGLIFLVTGLVLDLIITVPLFTGLAFFTTPMLYIGYVIMVCTVGVYGLKFS